MKKIIALIVSFAPVSVFAQQITNVDQLTSKATNIGNTIVVILISFSVIYIIYSVVKYLIISSEEGRTKAGMNILWGIVGLFVILSIWGLVAILKNTFSTNNNVPVTDFPKITTPPTI